MRFAVAVAILTMTGILFPAPGSMADDKSRLESGEVIAQTLPVQRSRFLKVRVIGIVDAPPSQVWGLVSKCGEYRRTLPSTSASKVVARKGRTVTCDIQRKLPPPLGKKRSILRFAHGVHPDQRYVASWRQVKGDYKKNAGRWVLMPYGEDGSKTHVLYEQHIEPKGSIPPALVTITQQNVLPRAIHLLRKLVK